MSAEHHEWIEFADENFEVARVALDHGYFNACLQNVQQAVEKYLKAVLIFHRSEFPRTHSIEMLIRKLSDIAMDISITEDDAELLDSIYIPSKYPLGNALPDFSPDSEICKRCLEVTEKVRESVLLLL